FFVLDACQSAGQISLDVQAIGCDVLSSTGRKYLRGPRGTGFLYVNERALERIEPPFLDLHSATWADDWDYKIRDDARRFENWETYYAGKLGLGAAVDYALELSVEATAERLQGLGAVLRSSLEEVPGVTVYDKGAHRGGIVTFGVVGQTAEQIKDKLSAAGINTSTSTPNYARFDLAHRGLATVVRASVHYYNTEEEIDKFIEELDR
ncbi:MAG: aminotransferase class V-fold PLP-dependent enzyme, partial [Acidimicrobiales bacterium]